MFNGETELVDVSPALTAQKLEFIKAGGSYAIVFGKKLQSFAADTLGIERPNFVAIVEELERRGLITRTRDLDDRRAYCLNATSAGLALADQAVKACQAHEEKLFGQLSAEDRAQLDRILRQFRTFESGR